MKIATRYPKTAALLVTLLMALPAGSVVDAQSAPGVPRIPGLPLPGPGSQCVQSEITEPNLLLALNAALAGQDPTTYFADQGGSPVLCGLDGQPLVAYSILMAQGKDVLDNYTSTIALLQQQADQRDAATVPQGDLVYPEVTLLKDDFAGHRVGGAGPWSVVTQQGEPDAFSVQQAVDANGTRGTYRFGDDSGYPRGIHQWLVSPMIDLDAVRGDAQTVSSVMAAENDAIQRLASLCDVQASPGRAGASPSTPAQTPGDGLPSTTGSLGFLCDQTTFGVTPGSGSPVRLLVGAFAQEVRDATAKLPVVRRTAQLDLDYGFNLANLTDGVRLWIYTGDHAPDRATLFSDTFGQGSDAAACATNPADTLTAGSIVSTGFGPGSSPAPQVTCRHDPSGGFLLGQSYGYSADPQYDVPVEGMSGPTAAFLQDAALPGETTSFTGDHPGVAHASIDLTNLTGKRAWVLFEVKTTPDSGRGGGFFSDRTLFPRSTGYGFTLYRVNATGQAWYRNARVEDVGANLPLSAEGNPYHDSVSAVRTVSPDLHAAPVVVNVMNAGMQTENGTLTVSLAVADAQGAFGAASPMGAPILVSNLTPSEVRAIQVPWGGAASPPRAGTLYRVTATLVPDEITGHTGDIESLNRTRETNPGSTPVRVPNHAADPTNDRTTATVDVRAYTRHALSAVPAKGSSGPALEVCAEVHSLVCTPSFTAKKGENRVLQVAVRNEGSQPETVNAQLLLSLDKVDKSAAVLDGPQRVLGDLEPGETRVVTWTIVPSDPGIYDAEAVFVSASGALATASRQVYVQRTTGTICFDNQGDDRECSATFQLSQPDFLKGRSFTAGVETPDGLLVAASNATGAALFLRAPDGTWNETPQGNLSGVGTIRAMLQGPDAVYLVGDGGAVVRDARGALTAIPLNASVAARFALTSATWWNGTLVAAGDSPVILVWNQTSKTMEPTGPIEYPHATEDGVVPIAFGGPVAALVANGPYLYLAGPGGQLLVNDGRQWNHTATPDGFAADMLGLAVRNGVVYAVGEGNSLLRARVDLAHNAVSFIPYAGIPTVDPKAAPRLVRAFPAPDGTLYVIDAQGDLAYCTACDNPAAPGWGLAEVPLPLVGSPAHEAGVVAAVVGDGVATLLAEGGVLLDHVPGSATYANQQDWTTLPLLYAKDGAVQTGINTQSNQAFRGVLPAPLPVGGSQNGFRLFRVVLDHNVMSASPAGEAFVRILYQQYPDSTLPENGAYNTCPRPAGLASGGIPNLNSALTPPTAPLGDVCHVSGSMVQLGNVFLQDVAAFSAPTASSGWEHLVIDNIAPGVYESAAKSQTGMFYGLELYKESGVRWAVDHVSVEGLNDTGWHELMHYDGASNHTGDAWRPYYVVSSTGSSQGVSNANFVDVANDWQEVQTPYYYTRASPWHVTTEGDRPVWAANNELMGGGSSPRLMDGYNARLVSPVLDLRGAYDPVVSFRQKFAFRTITNDAGTTHSLVDGDAGWIEVQYLRQGPDECPPPATSATTCGWSPFYRVRPDGDYPNGKALGFGDYTSYRGGIVASSSYNDYSGIGLGPNQQNPATGRAGSYWARDMRPDASGVFRDPLDTSTYEPASVDLNDAACRPGFDSPTATDCIPPNAAGGQVDLSGHLVRVAFHLLTWTSPNNLTVADAGDNNWEFNAANAAQQAVSPASYPGEGWYVTDFKVVGARPLGIDLAATNLQFKVGYDADRLGVGPGTRVPINVTVRNNGIYDALGYTGSLEIRRVLDPVAKTSTLLQTIPLAQQPLLEAGASVNHTFFWDVPFAEGQLYSISFHATPLGIDRDEDPTDNVALLGTLANPVVAHSRPEFHLDALVRPENATSQIPRAITLYLDNTGNVPLSGFRVTRDVQDLTGLVVDHRVYSTVRPVPEGTRVALASVADLDPSTDVFFQPPQNRDYKMVASATVDSTGQHLADGLTRTIRSLDAFLFDDAETGVQGEAFRGDWSLDPSWSLQSPGFRSDAAYGFGDPATNRYPADADASATLPLVDVGSARDAKVAFYQRYQFEPGFDAGVLQASADGGKTWTNLPASADPLNGLPLGVIGDTPLSAASPLHPTGNPDDAAFAVSGDSSTLPAAPGGWVFSQFDLTRFPNVTQQSVAYAFYRNPQLQQFAGTLGNATTLPPSLANPAVYTDVKWGATGDLGKRGYWEYDNLTQPGGEAQASLGSDAILPVAGDGALWWSGSASFEDDQRNVTGNEMLNVPLNLTGVTDPRAKVTLDWWEWADRFGQTLRYYDNTSLYSPQPGVTGFYNAFAGVVGDGQHPGQTYRFNVSKPAIVETRGRWYHMVADVSNLKGLNVNVSFAYAPKVGDALSGCGNTSVTKRISCYGNMLDDRGFAIDGFRVNVTQVVNGKPANGVTLLDPKTAWAAASVVGCANFTGGEHLWATGGTSYLPCYSVPGSSPNMTFDTYTRFEKGDPASANYAALVGRNWSLVPYVPGVQSNWSVVPVMDLDGKGMTPGNLQNALGETPRAWYSGYPGDPRCRDLTDATNGDGAAKEYSKTLGLTSMPCPLPGSESRLVTPVFDLSQIAGENAVLSFQHRYAFEAQKYADSDYPLASGGVVEAQVYDDASGTWGPWRQIYANDAMTPYPRNADGSYNTGLDMGKGYDGANPAAPARGGYSYFTVNSTPTNNGATRRYDPPFQAVPPVKGSPVRQDVQFLYSQFSTDTPYGAAHHGWVPASFDVSDLIGKKVRFGFHVFFSGQPAIQQKAATLTKPDGSTGSLRPDDNGGWWITNVSVVGDVLSGSPIQLRLRAATDGSVDDGHWQVDDVSVFGQRYGRNVGIFADESALHSTTPGHNVTIPVTIRNMGSTVRRGLAIDARMAPVNGANPAVVLSGDAPAGLLADPDASHPGAMLFLASPLAPGQSTTIHVTLTADKTLPNGFQDLLLLELREFNPTSQNTPYVPIRDNEVQGFLERHVQFEVLDHGSLSVVSATTTPVNARVGENATLTLRLANAGGVPLNAALSCSAEVYDHNVPTNHQTSPGREADVDRETIPSCGSASVPLPVGGSAVVSFQATPHAAGVLAFHVGGSVADGTVGGFNLTPDVFPTTLEMAIAAAPQAYATGFDNPDDAKANWSQGNAPNGFGWSTTRGHDGAGALEIGVNESTLAFGASYNDGVGPGGSYYQAVSPVIDLHNFTAQQPAFLTFWHEDRLARYDGASVSAQVVLDETASAEKPATGAFSCKLVPVGGYEGPITGWWGPQPPPTGGQSKPQTEDMNAAFGNETALPSAGASGFQFSSGNDYFTSPGGWEETWSKAVFDLANQPHCHPVGYNPGKGDAEPATRLSLLGHKIRLVFRVWVGPGSAIEAAQKSPLARGQGHAMLVDDLSVGPYNLEIHPQSQHAVLLDNVTKTFNVVVTNRGSFPDLARVTYDADNSSAPEGSVRPPADAFALQPGETRLVPVTVTLPRDPGLLPTTYRATLRVKSDLDGAVGGPTLVDLVFAPRQLADLGVSVALPVGAQALVQEGTEAFLPVTVDNHGLVDSQPSTLHVVDHWVEGGTDVAYDLPLPAIKSYYTSPDESTAVIEFHWKPARGAIGQHVLTFVADPASVGEEYSRSDNVVQATLPVTALLIPDLDVSAQDALTLRNSLGGVVDPAQDADVSRYEVTAGELASFELTVSNPGRAAATNVDVRASIGSLTLPAKSIAFIPAGGKAVVTFNWLAQKGEYNLSFDVRNEQLQLSTDNDHYPGTGLTLLIVKGYDVRLDLGQLADAVAAGADLKLPFNVTNDGNAGEDLQFVAQAPPGVSVTLPRDGLFLRAGETFSGLARVDVGPDAVAGAAEPQFIRVLAVSRENPMKVASGETPLAVRAEYAGSLVATVASASPPTIVVPITARNEGNSVAPWTVSATLPPGWTAQETLPAKLVVPPRGQATLALHVSVPPGTAPGAQAVQAHAVMPDGEARDGSVSVNVQPFRVASAKVVDSVAKPAEGALAYPVAVENAGNTKTPFQVVLTSVPPGVEASLEPSTFDLAPGAKTVATLLVKPNATVPAGSYPVVAYALFPGVTPDTAEGRANVQALHVSIARPDFQVNALEYAPRQGLSPGDRVTVRLPVANGGSGPASDVPVHLFVDDYFVGETRIPSLDAGAKTEVSFNWTAQPGAHTLTAVVDPYNDTVDPATADNAVSALVTVSGAGSPGGLAAQRSNVPGFEIVALLAAIAAALVVTPKTGSRRPPK